VQFFGLSGHRVFLCMLYVTQPWQNSGSLIGKTVHRGTAQGIVVGTSECALVDNRAKGSPTEHCEDSKTSCKSATPHANTLLTNGQNILPVNQHVRRLDFARVEWHATPLTFLRIRVTEISRVSRAFPREQPENGGSRLGKLGRVGRQLP
jgi:hypothetical protein